MGCQGPVVGAIYVFECMKNSLVSLVGVVWYIPVCRFVDQEWFGAENVNALIQKHAGTKSEGLQTTHHLAYNAGIINAIF